MKHKDINVGDELVYIPWRSSEGAAVKVLDTKVKLYSGSAVKVRFLDPTSRPRGRGAEEVVEARQLARPGSAEARAATPGYVDSRIAQIVLALSEMGYRENSPRGFRVRRSAANPTFLVSWEVLDQILDVPDAAARAGAGEASDPLVELFGGDE